MTANLIKKFTNVRAPILITGETGTGKSFLARKIFEDSFIHKEKFLTVHLASLKEELLESELFGYKKGAFTGAIDHSSGYLKEVGKGTLFLDEIGELSMASQKKLLYLLEEKKFTPVGSTTPLDFNGRIIMATNRSLVKMVEQGLFREDLYFRIKTFQVELPNVANDQLKFNTTLEQMWSELKIRYQISNLVLPDDVRDYLFKRAWKGNLRELKNSLEYALIFSNQRVIKIENFPEEDSKRKIGESQTIESFPEDFNTAVEIFESQYLSHQLLKNVGRVNETAKKLGMSKTTLIHKARKYQINTLKIRANASDCSSILVA